jgi:hypothetical protein
MNDSIPDSSILHDRDVQVMKNTDNNSFTVSRTDRVVIGFYVDQDFESILKSVFG